MLHRSKYQHVSPSSPALLEVKRNPVRKGQHSTPVYENTVARGIERRSRLFNPEARVDGGGVQ